MILIGGLIDSVDRELVDSPLRAYYHMSYSSWRLFYCCSYGRDDAWNGSDKGDVFLGVFDQSWDLIEQHRLTTYENGEAAMRPWVARKESSCWFHLTCLMNNRL